MPALFGSGTNGDTAVPDTSPVNAIGRWPSLLADTKSRKVLPPSVSTRVAIKVSLGLAQIGVEHGIFFLQLLYHLRPVRIQRSPFLPGILWLFRHRLCSGRGCRFGRFWLWNRFQLCRHGVAGCAACAQARPKAAFRPAARAVPPAAAAALRSGRVKSALQIFPTARKVLPLQVSVPLQAAPQERTVLAAGESERLQRAAQQLPRQTAAALRVELQHGQARPAQELPAAAGAVRISQIVQVPARSIERCRRVICSSALPSARMAMNGLSLAQLRASTPDAQSLLLSGAGQENSAARQCCQHQSTIMRDQFLSQTPDIHRLLAKLCQLGQCCGTVLRFQCVRNAEQITAVGHTCRWRAAHHIGIRFRRNAWAGIQNGQRSRETSRG